MEPFVAIDPAVEVACAVEQARGRAAAWAEMPVVARGTALRRLRDGLAADADALAEIISREIGKPLQEAYGADVLPSLRALDWLAKNAPKVMKRRRIAGR